ncbi:unnamed protein product [Protopolystoma xenopodis]|uniref:Uncharacterized protein n=1 Tax=Protopolystoma xenopodis TaxID=117903 RepID=A0A3S5CP99_9PLAT|nr:unnamed protein product [Protopolystoma xenopodis]
MVKPPSDPFPPKFQYTSEWVHQHEHTDPVFISLPKNLKDIADLAQDSGHARAVDDAPDRESIGLKLKNADLECSRLQTHAGVHATDAQARQPCRQDGWPGSRKGAFRSPAEAGSSLKKSGDPCPLMTDNPAPFPPC